MAHSKEIFFDLSTDFSVDSTVIECVTVQRQLPAANTRKVMAGSAPRPCCFRRCTNSPVRLVPMLDCNPAGFITMKLVLDSVHVVGLRLEDTEALNAFIF
jgi:hypothetical protein